MDPWLASRHRNAAPEYERGLNLSASGMSQSEDDECNSFNKKKFSRDPMSHRIIEKRRRDRMNNYLADLSRLIPAEYMKKGRGRVEKTEIIEMAIKHMKYLQSNAPSPDEYQSLGTKQSEPVKTEILPEQNEKSVLISEQYKMGFFECLTETMQYLVEGHGYPPGHGLCLSLINHLQNHCAQIVKGKQVIQEVIKDDIILEMNRFNTNMLMNLDEDGDGSYEDNSRQQNSSKNSKSQSSVSTSNDQTLPDRCNMSFTTDSYSSNGSMYKFKTDIKQRFSAENSGMNLTESMDLTDYYTQDKKRRRKESSDCNEDRQEVPIFALHENGSYYIPLTVNREVISPMLNNVLAENRSSVIVHPISISVNFQASNQF
ncbi:Hypothetical protein CINCED_3A001387 [Cinara cedri]|uniref:BHLH domain-containing protein n=1 Tax=Cinara cedri TaxID=506608 RepID=A0A5E4NRF4_9HEMI|nr:Hypothetical protein CINCED_3A001387 [Cinara cedri]